MFAQLFLFAIVISCFITNEDILSIDDGVRLWVGGLCMLFYVMGLILLLMLKKLGMVFLAFGVLFPVANIGPFDVKELTGAGVTSWIGYLILICILRSRTKIGLRCWQLFQ